MMKILDGFTSREKNIFYIIVLFFIFFLLFRILSGNYYLKDSYEYLDVAKRINNFSFLNTPSSSWSTKRPIVYPLFLAFFYNLPVLVTIVFQTILGICTLFIVFKIIKSFHIEIKKAYLWLFIFTPSIFIYTQLIMAECLVMFFLTVLFWLLIQKWSTRNFAYIQIITLLLAFTKPVFYPLIYVNFVFFGIYLIKQKRFSFWLFIPILVLQSYMISNQVRTGYKHFSSIENINLINYNLYYFKAKTESAANANLWLDSIYNTAYEEMNFKEKSNYLHSIATNEIRQNFFRYTFYHSFTAIRGVFDPGRFDLMTFFKREDGRQGFLELLNKKKSLFDLFKNKLAYIYILLIPVFLVNLIKWYYFARYLLLKKLNFQVYYIAVILACYVFISGPVNCSRYTMPFQGIIIIFAILGMNNQKIRKA